MTDLARVVAGMSRRVAEERAAAARRDLGLRPTDKVDMAALIDNLDELIDGFRFAVVEDHKLGGAEAVTAADRPLITFSLTTYAGLERGDFRARMTAAHELGHLLLHCGRPFGHAFLRRYDPLFDPERQADNFAAAFLMPETAFRSVRSLDEAMERFGVSREAACCRARKLRIAHKVGMYDPPPPAPKKKGRKS